MLAQGLVCCYDQQAWWEQGMVGGCQDQVGGGPEWDFFSLVILPGKEPSLFSSPRVLQSHGWENWCSAKHRSTHEDLSSREEGLEESTETQLLKAAGRCHKGMECGMDQLPAMDHEGISHLLSS